MQGSNQMQLNWDAVTDLDIAYYEIRYQNVTTGAQWNKSNNWLQVPRSSGTTTTVNSTTVNLNDHNIVLDTGNSTSAVINGAGITIDGSFNIPGTMSIHASQVYAKNISALVTYLCPEGKLKLDMDDEIVSGALFTHNGDITDERTKEALGGMA